MNKSSNSSFGYSTAVIFFIALTFSIKSYSETTFFADPFETLGSSFVYIASDHSPTRDVIINSSVTLSSIGGQSNGASAFYIDDDVHSIINNGTIQADYYPFYIRSRKKLDSLINNGLIQSLVGGCCGNNPVINNSGTINKLTNLGTIYGSDMEILNHGVINTLNNSGLINSSNYSGIYNAENATIGRLVNTGTISGDFSSIENYGAINQLDNLQSRLSIVGNLPLNYNIVISESSYGSLSSDPFNNGLMKFGLSSLSSGVQLNHGYHNVLQNVNFLNLSNHFDSVIVDSSYLSQNSTTLIDYKNRYTLTGLSNGYSYSLCNYFGVSRTCTPDPNYDFIYEGFWDLIVLSYTAPHLGPSLVDTQASLHSLAPKLRSGFNSQVIATNFANMNTYDCDLFDAKGVCVSVGGQQTYIDNPSTNVTSSVVTLGYKVSPQIRIGGFLNQNINNNTVSSVHMSNANPLMGLFAIWNQNEDRLGYQVKIANAYQDKDITTTREVVGLSEAGVGSTTLNTQSYVGELSYAFLANQEKTLVRPYAAVRYARIKQDGYTEDATVSTPLSYAALSDRSTTVLVGVKLNHKLVEKVNLTGSLGIEQDVYHHVDNLIASGVSGLTSENFNDNIKRTRPVASIGAYFMPTKNQRIAGDVYYQQLPFQSTGSTTAYVNYTIGF